MDLRQVVQTRLIRSAVCTCARHDIRADPCRDPCRRLSLCKFSTWVRPSDLFWHSCATSGKPSSNYPDSVRSFWIYVYFWSSTSASTWSVLFNQTKKGFSSLQDFSGFLSARFLEPFLQFLFWRKQLIYLPYRRYEVPFCDLPIRFLTLIQPLFQMDDFGRYFLIFFIHHTWHPP